MPRTWHRADRDLRCGYAWCPIAKDEAYQQWRLKSVGQVFIQCQQHADGPVDLEQMQASERTEPRPIPTFNRLTEGLRFDPKMRQAGEEG